MMNTLIDMTAGSAMLPHKTPSPIHWQAMG